MLRAVNGNHFLLQRTVNKIKWKAGGSGGWQRQANDEYLSCVRLCVLGSPNIHLYRFTVIMRVPDKKQKQFNKTMERNRDTNDDL